MTIAHVYRKSRFFWQKTNKRGLSPWRDMRICWPLGIFYSILIMRWNTITSSSAPCFAHCLGHQCKVCSHLLLFHFPTLGSQRTVFWNLEKYWAWISQNFSKNPYNFNSKKRLPLQFALKLRSKLRSTLCSLLWNYEANCEAPFAVSKQTTKHTLQFQTFLCSFHQSTKKLCSLDWNCKVCFVVCFETAKGASQFAS